MISVTKHSVLHTTGYARTAYLLENSFTNYLKYRKTLRELRRLDYRELDDLGLSAVSLKDVARKAVYG